MEVLDDDKYLDLVRKENSYVLVLYSGVLIDVGNQQELWADLLFFANRIYIHSRCQQLSFSLNYGQS